MVQQVTIKIAKVEIEGSESPYGDFISQMTPMVDSASYSVGKHNWTKVEAGKRPKLFSRYDCKARTVVGRRGEESTYAVTLDLGYE